MSELSHNAEAPASAVGPVSDDAVRRRRSRGASLLARVLILVSLIAAMGAANWLTWRSIQARPVVVAAADPSRALTWDAFATIATSTRGNQFPTPLLTRQGSVVEMVGVIFPMPQLVVDGALTAGVLAPPARFACCGLTCEQKGQTLVFVEPTVPPPAPTKQRLARVTGTLVLHPEPGSWCPTTISAARIEWLPDP